MELITNMKVHCLIHLIDFIWWQSLNYQMVEDLKWMTISYDSDCKYIDDAKSRKDFPIELTKEMKISCVKIALHIAYYEKNK